MKKGAKTLVTLIAASAMIFSLAGCPKKPDSGKETKQESYQDKGSWSGTPTKKPEPIEGQYMEYPPRDQENITTPIPSPCYHIVKKWNPRTMQGTLSGIAENYNTTVKELAKENGLTPPYALKPGQELKLPYCGKTITPDTEEKDILDVFE